MISKEEILKNLKALGIKKGVPVIVHTSLKAIGEIDGGAQALLDALIEEFANDGGVLCVPTHTWESMVLDLNRADSCIGVLPSVAAAHPDGKRSLHPTHSITVFGEKNRAEKFIQNEANSDSPTNPDGAYGNIYREDGYILLIGVGQEKNTFLHCVDEMLGIPNRLTDEKVTATIIHKNGRKETRHLRWFDPIIPDVSVNFGKLEEAFRYHGCIADGKIGNANVQICSARKVKSVMELIYKNANGEEILADKNPLDERLYKTGGKISE